MDCFQAPLKQYDLMSKRSSTSCSEPSLLPSRGGSSWGSLAHRDVNVMPHPVYRHSTWNIESSVDYSWRAWTNEAISHIPQSIWPISHNAPFWYTELSIVPVINSLVKTDDVIMVENLVNRNHQHEIWLEKQYYVKRSLDGLGDTLEFNNFCKATGKQDTVKTQAVSSKPSKGKQKLHAWRATLNAKRQWGGVGWLIIA